MTTQLTKQEQAEEQAAADKARAEELKGSKANIATIRNYLAETTFKMTPTRVCDACVALENQGSWFRLDTVELADMPLLVAALDDYFATVPRETTSEQRKTAVMVHMAENWAQIAENTALLSFFKGGINSGKRAAGAGEPWVAFEEDLMEMVAKEATLATLAKLNASDVYEQAASAVEDTSDSDVYEQAASPVEDTSDNDVYKQAALDAIERR